MSDALKVENNINRLIKNAWGAALLSALINLGFTIYFWSAGQGWLANVYNVLYSFIVIALAYGIYRRSRICAAIMLLLFIIVKAMDVRDLQSSNSIFITMFIIMFCGGVVGAFFYHRSVSLDKEITNKHITIASICCIIVALFGLFSMKLLLTESAEQAWEKYKSQNYAEIAKLSLPVRIDYYTVLKSIEFSDKKLIYTYAIENVNINDADFSIINKNNREIFIKNFCKTAMVNRYGLIVEHVYTQGLTEKIMSYDKIDCVG